MINEDSLSPLLEARKRLDDGIQALKEKHPELYCPVRRCLWKTGDGSYCPRHEPIKSDPREAFSADEHSGE